MYTHMAHYVGKTLGIRPNEILDTWCVPELIVAYGEYMNEEAAGRFAEWECLHGSKKGATPPRPKRYAVRFIGVREME